MNAWLERTTGYWLHDPVLLWCALLVPLALLVRRWYGAVRAPMPSVSFAIAGEGHPPRSLRQRLLFVPFVLQSCGLLLVVFALARPVVRSPLPLVSEGIEVLICLDVSSSMAELDMDASRTRLDLAKEAAERFVRGRPQDRIGLITFARDPELVCPPTLDHRTLLELLHAVELVAKDSSEDQTGIGAAVARAAEMLRDAESRVVILWTDGEENVASARSPEEIGPFQAAWLCEQLEVRVYVIAAGLGRPGPGGRFVPVDTAQVEELARRSGGAFFAARDAAAVERVYRQIDRLERVEFQEPRFELRERARGFVLLGAALLLLAFGLRRSVLEVLP